MTAPSRRAVICAALGAPLLAPTMSACTSASASSSRLRLGYFANLTHAPALIGMRRGLFAKHLASTAVEPQVFTSGPLAVQAMLAGALDIAYLGPAPAVTAWVRTKGQGVRVIAGATGGGAALVVRPDIETLDQLRGKTIATPQLGGTQDVALKVLLRKHNIPISGGANGVNVVWMANSQTFDQFRQGRIDGAYLPEPWVSRLVVEAGARELVDEATQWPGGKFPTTTVLVSQEYERRFPQHVRSFLTGHLDALAWLDEAGAGAAKELNAEIKQLTGKKLKPAVVRRALESLSFSADPLANTLPRIAQDNYATGSINVRPDLPGMLDLRVLNLLRGARGQRPVSDAGLGVDGKAAQ